MVNDFRRYDDESVLNKILKNQKLDSFDFIMNNPSVMNSVSKPHRPTVHSQLEEFFDRSGFFNYYQIYEPIPIATNTEKKLRGWISPELLKSNYPGKKPPVFSMERSESLPQLDRSTGNTHLLTHLSFNRSSKGYTPNRLEEKLLKNMVEDLKIGILNAVCNLNYFVKIKKSNSAPE